MATQDICFYNKYGFCKYLETCRKKHENSICEKKDCEILKCTLRHPKDCKFYSDYGFCKFSEWCRFSHNNSNARKNLLENDEIKKLKDNLKTVETVIEKNNEKVRKLESDIIDMNKKMSEKKQTISKINKKYNFLKEKVTLLFDLEAKFDVIEKKVEKILITGKDAVSEDPKSNITSEDADNLKCSMCDFVGKNKFGLKIHYHKKHSTATFKCDTCDFTCESHSDLVEHNDRYYHSHRRKLNKENEKLILDEFQQLDADGFLIHRKLDW